MIVFDVLLWMVWWLWILVVCCGLIGLTCCGWLFYYCFTVGWYCGFSFCLGLLCVGAALPVLEVLFLLRFGRVVCGLCLVISILLLVLFVGC